MIEMTKMDFFMTRTSSYITCLSLPTVYRMFFYITIRRVDTGDIFQPATAAFPEAFLFPALEI